MVDLIKKKIRVGSYVVIGMKNSPKQVKGMVKRIIRASASQVLVELVDGSVGIVLRVPSKRASLKVSLNRNSFQKKEVSKESLYQGEGQRVEYKADALWSQNLRKDELEKRGTPETRKYGQRASKIILAKEIAAFLNSSGGDLIIGVSEKGKEFLFEGVEGEFGKLRNKNYNEDGYKRMIIDDVIRPYFPKFISNHLSDYISITFPRKEGKTLCRVKVRKSSEHVFLTIDKRDYFFIRVDTETRELHGSQIVDYVRRVFG